MGVVWEGVGGGGGYMWNKYDLNGDGIKKMTSQWCKTFSVHSMSMLQGSGVSLKREYDMRMR